MGRGATSSVTPDRAQLLTYKHFASNGYGYEISRIPNDCIEFGGRTYLQYASVRNWNTSGDVSLMAGVAYYDDYGVTWQDYPTTVPEQHRVSTSRRT